MEKGESSEPLTADFLKSLFASQRNDIKKDLKDSEDLLKEEIQKSEKKVIQHMEDKLVEVKTDIDDIKIKLQEKDLEIQTLKDESDREKRSRNIVIFKIPENESGVLELKGLVIELILESCKVDIKQHIDRIYRIGRKDVAKIRPIRLSLISFDKKMEIMSGKKQNQSNLEISEDFSPAILESRRKLVPVLKKLRDLNYKNVQLRQDKLFIDGKLCDEEVWKELISTSTQTEDMSRVSCSSTSSTAPSPTEDASLVINTVNPFSSPNIKRPREPGMESSPRANKQTKTTIIGATNSNAKFSSPKNPVKEALKKQMLNASRKITTKPS